MPIVTFLADNPLHVHQLIRFNKEENCYLLRELGGISSCSCVPIVPFLFRLTTRLAAHQFSGFQKENDCYVIAYETLPVPQNTIRRSIKKDHHIIAASIIMVIEFRCTSAPCYVGYSRK